MTASCRDTDRLSKVTGAGKVVNDVSGRIQIMHNGLRVVADGYYGAWMTELIESLDGVHEPQEELLFHYILSHCRPNSVCAELGRSGPITLSGIFRQLKEHGRFALSLIRPMPRLDVGMPH